MGTSEVFRDLVKHALGEFSGAKPAYEKALQDAEAALAIHLPDDYKDFLRMSDGGEGFIDRNYVILWSVGETVEHQIESETGKYAPGLLLFGSNGGGEALEPERFRGLEIFQIKPIILGGDPVDLANKVFLNRKQHIEAVRYWNRLIQQGRKDATR